MRKLGSMLQRVGDRLARTRAEKRRLSTAARVLAHHLQPGIWWFPGVHVLVRAGAGRMPAHLRSSMAPRVIGVRAVGRALVRVLVPPVWAWVPRRAHAEPATTFPAESGAASLLYLGPNGTYATLVDRTGGAVTRVAFDRRLPMRVLAIRDALREYLPMPAFEVSDDRTVIREELVDGRPFGELATDERAEAFEALLTHYGRLVRQERRSARSAAIAMAFDSFTPLAGDDRVWAHLLARRTECVTRSARWPCVPSHGDLSASNLVFSPGGVRLIDFEFADVLPFFYDIAKLMLDEASCGRADLLVGIGLGGRFERRWHDLWIGAGHSSAPDTLLPVLTAVVVLYGRRLQRLRPSRTTRTVLEGAHDVPKFGAAPRI